MPKLSMSELIALIITLQNEASGRVGSEGVYVSVIKDYGLADMGIDKLIEKLIATLSERVKRTDVAEILDENREVLETVESRYLRGV